MKAGEEEKVDGKIGSKLSGKYLSHLARRKKKRKAGLSISRESKAKIKKKRSS